MPGYEMYVFRISLPSRFFRPKSDVVLGSFLFRCPCGCRSVVIQKGLIPHIPIPHLEKKNQTNGLERSEIDDEIVTYYI